MEVLIEEIEVSKTPTKKTTTGLGAFAGAKAKPKLEALRRAKPVAKAKPAPAPPIAAEISRKRGPAKTYEQPRRGVTLRFTDEQHDALRQFAFEERTTIQDLALRGIAMMFEERGLPKPW